METLQNYLARYGIAPSGKGKASGFGRRARDMRAAGFEFKKKLIGGRALTVISHYPVNHTHIMAELLGKSQKAATKAVSRLFTTPKKPADLLTSLRETGQHLEGIIEILFEYHTMVERLQSLVTVLCKEIEALNKKAGDFQKKAPLLRPEVRRALAVFGE